ncbi:hypothetical protein [Streptomyces atratus]|uniref:hypothetical protein n=1 Tax=Streptomyces atratus TaxID=1893 RepID=UPI002250AA56|nr:hypothetical protein [Streptomyces atratus]MCX5339518.1 hypothetical protein [Streptomyces atratus]
MVTRSTVVTAALAAAAALAATGITYASAASTEPAQAAPVVQQQAAAPVSAPNGGNGGNGGNGNEGNGNEGNGNEGKGNEGKGGGGGGYENEGGGRENKGHREHFRGRIQINERTYTAEGGGCITVVSGLGSKTLNIRNESRRTVEVFRGATCDNGAPLATVGPWSSSDGVHPGRVRGGVKVHNGVVGSFRVIERHHGGGDFGGGDFGGDY